MFNFKTISFLYKSLESAGADVALDHNILLPQVRNAWCTGFPKSRNDKAHSPTMDRKGPNHIISRYVTCNAMNLSFDIVLQHV